MSDEPEIDARVTLKFETDTEVIEMLFCVDGADCIETISEMYGRFLSAIGYRDVAVVRIDRDGLEDIEEGPL